jgi:hypothetical protein
MHQIIGREFVTVAAPRRRQDVAPDTIQAGED